MMDNIDEVTDKRMKALKEIEKDKLRVARAYNKKVKDKSFQVGDLVWKTILPLGMKRNKFGKWSPSWEGPYILHIFLCLLEPGTMCRNLEPGTMWLNKYAASLWLEHVYA